MSELYAIWRRQHGKTQWAKTAHQVTARTENEAQVKMRRRFKTAGFSSMSLVAIKDGIDPNEERRPIPMINEQSTDAPTDEALIKQLSDHVDDFGFGALSKVQDRLERLRAERDELRELLRKMMNYWDEGAISGQFIERCRKWL